MWKVARYLFISFVHLNTYLTKLCHSLDFFSYAVILFSVFLILFYIFLNPRFALSFICFPLRLLLLYCQWKTIAVYILRKFFIFSGNLKGRSLPFIYCPVNSHTHIITSSSCQAEMIDSYKNGFVSCYYMRFYLFLYRLNI